jgi:hypothetical protein
MVVNMYGASMNGSPEVIVHNGGDADQLNAEKRNNDGGWVTDIFKKGKGYTQGYKCIR